MHTPFLPDTSNYLRSDIRFNLLFPPAIRRHAGKHWTPLHISRLATAFLAEKPNVRVLDIGSGVGKFCLSAACYAPEVHFTGVEQRGYLVHYAQEAQEQLGIENVSFIEGNFTELDFSHYDHFYFFNSFYENLEGMERIDNIVDHAETLYDYYVRRLYLALKDKPPGTRIVTYHSLQDEIPRTYRLTDSLENGELNFWIRQ